MVGVAYKKANKISAMIARAAMLQHMHAFFCLISRPPFLQRLTEMVKRFFQICRR